MDRRGYWKMNGGDTFIVMSILQRLGKAATFGKPDTEADRR